MMRAAVMQQLGQPLRIERLPDPTPGPGELVVRVGRCGICGSDLHMTEDPAYGKGPGTVLGHEFAGEVVALGRRTDGIGLGDLVSVIPLASCGQCAACLAGEPACCAGFALQGGGYAEYAVTRPNQCVRLPKTANLADRAIIEPLAVALHGVNMSGMKPGDRVLILGAAARALDAADIVFECVGRPGLIAQAVRQVRSRGTILLLGLCTQPDTFNSFAMLSKEVRLITSAFLPGRNRRPRSMRSTPAPSSRGCSLPTRSRWRIPLPASRRCTTGQTIAKC